MKSVLKWLLIAVAAATVLFVGYGVVLYFQVKDLYRVSSDSMAPALITGDVIKIDKDAYRTQKPELGEVVAYDPQDGGGIRVHRIVAMPGQKVAFPNRRLVIDDKPVEIRSTEKTAGYEMFEEKLGSRTYLVTYMTSAASLFESPALMTVDQYFLAGDNRDGAKDSRSFGPVTIAQIRGRVVKIVESKDPKRVGREL